MQSRPPIDLCIPATLWCGEFVYKSGFTLDAEVSSHHTYESDQRDKSNRQNKWHDALWTLTMLNKSVHTHGESTTFIGQDDAPPKLAHLVSCCMLAGSIGKIGDAVIWADNSDADRNGEVI